MGICQGLASNSSSELFAAWKGETGDDRLLFATFNGSTWTNRGAIPGNSSVGPALAFNKGTLYAAWKGIYGDNRLFSAQWNGSNWVDGRTIAGNSDIGPTLASQNGKLYAAWKGEADLNMFFAEFDAGNWLPQAQIVHNGSSSGFTSCMGPSLTNLNGILLAVWRGAIYDQKIYYATFNGSWSAPAVLPNALTSTCPSVATSGTNAYVVWKGEGTDERMFFGWFDSSMTWHDGGQITDIPCTSSLGAALCSFGSDLFAMWKGAGSDQQLSCGSFNGTAWTVEPNAPGNTGGDKAPMPSGGLGSSSNYIFCNNCEPITALSVEITLTEPLATTNGFAFQLNCNAGLNQKSAWQQYILVYYPPPGAQQFACQIDNWTTTAELMNSALPYFGYFAGPTVPSGTVFKITLKIDANSHSVTGANYSVQLPGQNPYTKSLLISELTIDKGQGGGTPGAADMSPIAAFQLNLVALDTSQTHLITGAGNIVYTVSPAMSGLTDFPACVEYHEVTGEGTNSVYGQLPLGASRSYTQWFAAAAT
jgi:hypothetical protein